MLGLGFRCVIDQNIATNERLVARDNHAFYPFRSFFCTPKVRSYPLDLLLVTVAASRHGGSADEHFEIRMTLHLFESRNRTFDRLKAREKTLLVKQGRDRFGKSG